MSVQEVVITFPPDATYTSMVSGESLFGDSEGTGRQMQHDERKPVPMGPSAVDDTSYMSELRPQRERRKRINCKASCTAHSTGDIMPPAAGQQTTRAALPGIPVHTAVEPLQQHL